MREKPKLFCDECEKQIEGIPGYPLNDHIAISAVASPTEPSGFAYAIMQYPKLDRTYEFCSLGCAGKWMQRKAEK